MCKQAGTSLNRDPLGIIIAETGLKGALNSKKYISYCFRGRTKQSGCKDENNECLTLDQNTFTRVQRVRYLQASFVIHSSMPDR